MAKKKRRNRTVDSDPNLTGKRAVDRIIALTEGKPPTFTHVIQAKCPVCNKGKGVGEMTTTPHNATKLMADDDGRTYELLRCPKGHQRKNYV